MTEQELLAAARRQGHKVSADQLKRWRRADLIPRPVQAHQPGVRGSRTTYPPGTLRQLVRVCELHTHFRKLDRVRFELWWAGEFPGDLQPIRDYLTGRLDRLLGPLRDLRGRYEKPFDAALSVVESEGPRPRDPLLRAIRRLAQTDENLRSVMVAMLTNLFGGDAEWESKGGGPGDGDPSRAELAELASGVKRAKSDTAHSGQPLLDSTANIVEAIQRIVSSGVIDLDHPGGAITAATDQQLVRAAKAALILMEGLKAFARVTTRVHGRDYAGLGILAGLDLSDPTFIALTIQQNLQLPELLQTAEEQHNAATNLQALRARHDELRCEELFCLEHPDYAFIFGKDRDARLEQLSQEERDLLAVTVNKFLQKHPECAALVTDDE